MTVAQLRRSMDRRFDRLERKKADKADLRTLSREMRAEFRRRPTTARLERELGKLRGEFGRAIDEARKQLEAEMARRAEETRRHFDVVAESLRSDIQLLAEAAASYGVRLETHDRRLVRLETRA